MNSLRYLRVIIFSAAIVTFTMVFDSTHTAWACTGEPSYETLNSVIEEADFIVEASFVQSDDAGKNLVIQATNYLTGGSGPEYLLLYQVSPVLSAVYDGHLYQIGCLDNGAALFGEYPTTVFDVDITEAYFPVKRQVEGYYTLVGDPYWRFVYQLPFAEDDIPVRVVPNAEDSEDNERRILIQSEREFVELVANLSGESTSEPRSEAKEGFSRPLLAPLSIMTDTGASYQLPVDWGNGLIEYDRQSFQQFSTRPIYPQFFSNSATCVEIECTAWVLDRSLLATQSDHNTLWMNYPFGAPDKRIVFSGQAFAFSPKGELLLVWNENTLYAHPLGIELCLECGGGGAYIPDADKQGTRLSNNATTEFHGQAIANAAGTRLIFRDSQGLWTIATTDISFGKNGSPQPLLNDEVSSNSVPLFLSTSGRYLAYSNNLTNQQWITRDLETGAEYENAIPSPTEEFMVQIASEDELAFSCKHEIPCTITLDTTPDYVEWVTADILVVAMFSSDSVNEGTLQLHHFAESYSSVELDISLYDIVYEPDERRFAIITDKNQIAVSSQLPDLLEGNWEFFEIDFSDRLDSEIVSIEWMPSLFYRHLLEPLGVLGIG